MYALDLDAIEDVAGGRRARGTLYKPPDLDAARRYLHVIAQMAGEGARSDNAAVVLLALRLVELQAPRTRALARAA